MRREEELDGKGQAAYLEGITDTYVVVSDLRLDGESKSYLFIAGKKVQGVEGRGEGTEKSENGGKRTT